MKRKIVLVCSMILTVAAISVPIFAENVVGDISSSISINKASCSCSATATPSNKYSDGSLSVEVKGCLNSGSITYPDCKGSSSTGFAGDGYHNSCSTTATASMKKNLCLHSSSSSSCFSNIFGKKYSIKSKVI